MAVRLVPPALVGAGGVTGDHAAAQAAGPDHTIGFLIALGLLALLVLPFGFVELGEEAHVGPLGERAGVRA